MMRLRLIQYLRKQLTRQPLAVPGSGGGKAAGAADTLPHFVIIFN